MVWLNYKPQQKALYKLTLIWGKFTFLFRCVLWYFASYLEVNPVYTYIYVHIVGWVWFYDISTIVGYLRKFVKELVILFHRISAAPLGHVVSILKSAPTEDSSSFFHSHRC